MSTEDETPMMHDMDSADKSKETSSSSASAQQGLLSSEFADEEQHKADAADTDAAAADTEELKRPGRHKGRYNNATLIKLGLLEPNGTFDDEQIESACAAAAEIEAAKAEEAKLAPKRKRGRPKGSGKNKGVVHKYRNKLVVNRDLSEEELSLMCPDLDENSTDDEILNAFKGYMILERNASENTYLSYCFDLKLFLSFLTEHNYSRYQFPAQAVRDYLQERSAAKIKASTLNRYMSATRLFVRFLQAEDLREDDPMDEVERPNMGHHLPMVMSEETVTLFLNAPDTTCYVGMRDKAMLELIYACGLRVSELCNLTFSDLNLAERYLLIKGKGGKQRIIPMTNAAVYWIRLYVYEFRPQKDPALMSNYVFLSSKCAPDQPSPMSRIGFWLRIKHYSLSIGLKRRPSPHTFRHAFATHLLNHDADLRSLQLLLGHASVNTTQIYTHVALARMHEVYDKTHPLS